jgi:hypothetical protein
MGILIRRRKTETVSVTYEFVRLTGQKKAITTWCDQCANETKLLPPEDVVLLTGVSARALYRAVEVGDVHFMELTKGNLLICVNSVAHPVSVDGNPRC